MLKTTIDQRGQPFVDEPVMALPKQASPIEASVAAAYGRKPPRPITLRHERIKLQWMKPDGNGGLVPR